MCAQDTWIRHKNSICPSQGKGMGRVSGQQGLSRLGLVLALCGCEEVLQNTSKVVKRGPVLGTLLPAQHHEVVQLLRTVVRSDHSVASLQILNHFRVGHSWKVDGRKNIKPLNVRNLKARLMLIWRSFFLSYL